MPTPDRRPAPRRHGGARRSWPVNRDEAGIALIITMSIMMIVALMTASIFASDLSALPQAAHENAYLQALQAAESGVEDYLARLESSPSYWQYDAANPGTPVNPAFRGWVPVPGPAANEWFSYAVDNSTTSTTGMVWLISSGAAGPGKSVVRTVKVGLSEKGFTSFLYVTAHEILDPTITGLPVAACGETASQYNAVASAAQGSPYYGPDLLGAWEALAVGGGSYYWAYVPYCSYNFSPELIQFSSSDVLNGKVESADEFHVCGSPSFPAGAYSSYDQPTSLGQPPNPTNGNQGTKYGGPGAYYDMNSLVGAAPSRQPPRGATWQGHTWNPRTDRVYSTGYNYGGCSGTPKGPSGQPWSAASGQPGAASVQFPTNNNALASDTTANPAAGNPGGCLYNGPISVTLSASGSGSGRMTVSPASALAYGGAACTGSDVALPPNGVLYDQTASSCTRSGCRANVTVRGMIAGQVTIGSANDITIVGSLKTASTTSTSDILGLSAANDVIVQHGANCSKHSGSSTCLPNLTIDAAIYAGNSFYVANWGSGSPMGSLNVLGSIAQNYRGPVGTGNAGGISTGYNKNYNYDSRLAVVQPPYFTSPVNPPWVRDSFGECAPTPPPLLSGSTCSTGTQPVTPGGGGSSGDGPDHSEKCTAPARSGDRRQHQDRSGGKPPRRRSCQKGH